MEKDVNIIIDIDEDEALLLIKLLEDLFQDWYINRHEQEERNKKLRQIADAKQAAKTSNP
jgi:aminoglycoside/choline kinase family phosphotransferase